MDCRNNNQIGRSDQTPSPPPLRYSDRHILREGGRGSTFCGAFGCGRMSYMKKFIGIDLKYIKRVALKKGELGYDRLGMPLDYYYMDLNAPIDLYTTDKPMAILNLSNDSKLTVVAYVNLAYRSNIETVENEPLGYEMIIVTWFDLEVGDKWELQ